MEGFLVSARKYRPATFDTVVGQKSITTTLKNAIRNNNIAQAFLFTGPRGVGKTTCARILAKTINCQNLDENLEACNQCEPCKAFNESSAFNVHELDAASNNSVDNIRGLVDAVRIPPQIGRYKVYIIDEVHMLSTQAFNAFLKTLEEPPAYAKFILATTEKHKIIPTILSRCQIFDFARITVEDIAKHLQHVAEKEGVNADPNALRIIAQKADGALRDSLSIFDQMVSFSGKDLTYKKVIENLNVLDYDYYFKITDYLLEGKSSEVLLLLNEIIFKGFDGSEFIIGFGEHLRNLLIGQNSATIELIEVSNDIKEKYLQQAKLCEPDFLLGALEINTRADLHYKESNNKRLTMELALLQMAGHVKKKKPELIPPKAPLATPEKGLGARTLTVEEPISPTKLAPTAKQVVTEPLPHFHEPAIKNEDATETSVPVIESPNTPVKKTFKPISLKIHGTNEPEQTSKELPISNENKPRDSISDALFQEVWRELAESYQDQSLSLFAALTTYEAKIDQDYHVSLIVDNAIQENLILEKKSELLAFLRKELNNYFIEIETRVVENKKRKKPLDPKEKLEKLARKNTEVKNLCKEFGLDLFF